MIKKNNIAVLCNNRMAIPALQTLHSQGSLHSIGVPESNTDLLDFCNALNMQAGVPFKIFKKDDFITQLQEWITDEAAYIFTMTFPWKIPARLIETNPGKFYNFHYGLLPEMRGADPVFETIRQQNTETGITVHSIERDIDKGAVILKKVLPLNLLVTHGMLCTQLSYLGAQILPEVLSLLASGTKGVEQDETIARYYRRPAPADVCVRWDKQDAKAIEALTRACNPWNKGAYTHWNGWNIRIVEAAAIEEISDGNQMPGSILELDEANGIKVQCLNNTLLKLKFIYTDEGYMSAPRLGLFGIKKGERFISI